MLFSSALFVFAFLPLVPLAELPWVGAPAELLLKPRLPATSVTLEALELRAP